MQPEPNKQQIDWLELAKELNDVEAAQVNGGRSSDSGSRGNPLCYQLMDMNMHFQEDTAQK